MFTGSELAGDEESTPRDATVALGAGGTIMVKFSKADTYRLIIKRVQPFKSFEVSLVRSIIEEMGAIYATKLNMGYIKDMEAHVIQKAICNALSSNAGKTLHELLGQMESWSQRTYEGGKVMFGFIVSTKRAPQNTNKNLNISRFLKSDFSALLSDGQN